MFCMNDIKRVSGSENGIHHCYNQCPYTTLVCLDLDVRSAKLQMLVINIPSLFFILNTSADGISNRSIWA